jgi:tRNA (guanine37-N1)-methyltransferase
MLNIKVLTLFPEMFPGPLGLSVVGEALKQKKWNLEVFDIRDYCEDLRKTVDDVPYGGGSGMVLKPDILGRAIEGVTGKKPEDYLIIYPSPRGELLKQKKIVEIAKNNNMLLLLGRYEGVDQRVIDEYNIFELSIGDYVLSGGEIAAYAMIDAAVRTLPGVLGNAESLSEESFAVGTEYENLLEYPIYTRPKVWKGLEVPEILCSGNHGKIAEWRFSEAKKITEKRRPDLLIKK